MKSKTEEITARNDSESSRPQWGEILEGSNLVTKLRMKALDAGAYPRHEDWLDKEKRKMP